MKKEVKNLFEFGMIGLGTMGSNLLQNIADHGFSCAGYDINLAQVTSLNELGRENIRGFSDLKDFTRHLKSPRIVMLLVPAGKIVDVVIDDLLSVMEKGDIIIDGGNSHFVDTDRRYKMVETKGMHFIGMGISGGEEGARSGPSMMPGGDRGAFKKVKPVLEKIAAQTDAGPTVAYMGSGSAGHFVKMVHNGIEYALMQLISETFEFMAKGLKMEDDAIHAVFKRWNEGRLQSYLMEITRDILAFKSPGEDHLLFKDIKDQAKAKGTGKWTSQAAMDLGVPVPVIDISVSMRDLSIYKSLRTEASKLFPDVVEEEFKENADTYLAGLEQAFYFGMATAFAQGMHLLYKASEEYAYGLNLDVIAKIWRGGCIIRAAFLDDIFAAYKKNSTLQHLFLDDEVRKKLVSAIPGIRRLVADAARHGISVPAFSAALSYFDAFRNENMPANLIMAQRDYFGSHTYELRGKEGIFHTQWQKDGK